MKRFSKIALSVAAVSAVTAAMAISASAMTASYADGTVTLSDVTATGASQTLLVLDTVDLETVAEINIKQIDQKDDGTSFSTVTVGTLADGTYEVRIGGDGTVQKTTFKVGGDDPAPTYKLGDVDESGIVDVTDALWTVQAAVGNKDLTDAQKLAADVDKSEVVDVTDALWIVQTAVGNRTLE